MWNEESTFRRKINYYPPKSRNFSCDIMKMCGQFVNSLNFFLPKINKLETHM